MENSTKKMYVLLIRSKSLPSTLIRMMTRAVYTHASLGFTEDCTELYSFARKYQKLPFPGKFMSERIDKGFLGKNPKTPCALYSFDVTEKAFEKIKEYVNEMYKNHTLYKYNYLGVVLCGLGIRKKTKNRFFCSEFVASALKKTGEVNIFKDPSLFKPVDFQKLSELKLLYEGNIGGLRNKMLINGN